MEIEISTDGVEFGGDLVPETKPAPQPAPEAAEEAPEEVLELTEEDEAVTEDDEGDAPKKSKDKSAGEYIRELRAERKALRAENERLRASETNSRLDAIEKLLGGEIKLQGGATSGNVDTSAPPDPNDQSKYPLGSLDDRYIEDLTDWKVDQKFRAAQQRQLENDAKAEADRVATENLQKGRAVVEKGVSTYADFEEVVWEAGMRGEYEMSEPTFHALTEAEHGADIAYALASNKAEAARVARLTPFQQLQYVMTKDAEFKAKKATRKVPQAGDPPSHQARGASGRYTVDYNDINASHDDISRALFNRN